MTIRILALIIISVTLSAVAQITMKRGVEAPEIQQALTEPIRALGKFAGNGYVLTGLLLYGVGAAIWLFVLARLDVSMAYPFMALGFALTVLLGALLLGEQVGPARLLGTSLIVLGVVLVARS